MPNTPLARMFEYDAWASQRIIDACRNLADDDLDAEGAGAYGSIRRTLLHVVHGQWSLLARLDGGARDTRALSPPWTGFDALTAEAQRSGDALLAAAEALDTDSEVVLTYMGKSYRYPKSFFLLHAIQHGVEHRTQIGMMLARLGKDAPDLDGWAFAAAARLGEEVTMDGAAP